MYLSYFCVVFSNCILVYVHWDQCFMSGRLTERLPTTGKKLIFPGLSKPQLLCRKGGHMLPTPFLDLKDGISFIKPIEQEI